MLKEYIADIDESVLKDLFYAAQFALNDMDTQKRVSAETGLSVERIDALNWIAIDLSCEQRPELTTEADVEKEAQKNAELRSKYPNIEAGFVYADQSCDE
jgi:hypothetical protein